MVRRLKPLPSRRSLKAREHKTARLVEILRGIAVSSQTEKSQVFYPVRDVAQQFGMSVSIVARAYDQLGDEGLLSTVRGSKTVLQGLGEARHLSVLGFVGMPAAISSFVALQDYRTFFVRVRRELRARGFAVAMVLYDSPDVKSGRLEKRIVKYDFDTVLWYRPDTSAREIISRAITEILRYWKTKAEISSVTIVRGVRASAKEETLERLLEEEHLPFEFRSADGKAAAKFLKSLGQVRTKGIIFPSWAASMFAFREPEGLMQLANNCHIAFTGGPPSIAFAQVHDVHVELVIVDWQLVAEKIVSDLISKKAFERAEATVFKASAHVRAALSQYAQVI